MIVVSKAVKLVLLAKATFTLKNWENLFQVGSVLAHYFRFFGANTS